ncbi:CobW family GTP-binding protein [Halomonas urumqiensis]|uniref:GTP-binding protein n=1 Tax=Halomonas urumqiensis TaxID=1684789 RepID=A0A2N7ULN7_9GAMM|nr:GTP-binding protein [Halomonas urumqiensis]PMR81351.1 GTP-binding protein [Halomonas urumqiensis]PTB01151.1 GTP-binding protein [Halomonas urumqiensis]GHE22718.1 cobalamin biosynthesis protein CobW [Halomonas urumqiensis]
MPQTLSDIPVHLITGFLGSGKSTLINRLIEQKPNDERWAVVINEFGQVGIDQAMFSERDDLVVKGLPGGCLCCQLAFVMQATLVNLLHRQRPDRLIIEPTGLGHPAGLLEVLRGEAFAGVLDVRDIIAVLDPRRLDDPRSREHATFRDQLAVADSVVLTMTDLATPEQLAAAHQYASAQWPKRRWVAEAAYGEVPISLLIDAGRHRGELPQTDGSAPHDHKALREAAGSVVMLDDFALVEPRTGEPVHESGHALGYDTLGFRWHPADAFDLDRVTALLGALPAALRVKAVLHTEAGWKLYNRAEGTVNLGDCAWRRDSRLEVIGEQGTLPEAEWLVARLRESLLP